MELAALECKEKDEWPEDGKEDLEDPGKFEREQDEEEVEAAGEWRPLHQGNLEIILTVARDVRSGSSLNNDRLTSS